MLGVLILSSVVGGVAGAALGSLAGGVGAIPAGAAGAELGFNVGMALLTWMGVAALVPLVAHHLGKMLQTAQRGIAKAWHAGQSRFTSEEQDIDDGGKLLGEAVGEFFVAFLEGLVMWVLKDEGVSSTKGSVAKLANPKSVMERQALLSAQVNEMYIMLRNSRLGPRFAEWFRSNINGLIEAACSTGYERGGGGGRIDPDYRYIGRRKTR